MACKRFVGSIPIASTRNQGVGLAPDALSHGQVSQIETEAGLVVPQSGSQS